MAELSGTQFRIVIRVLHKRQKSTSKLTGVIQKTKPMCGGVTCLNLGSEWSSGHSEVIGVSLSCR